MTATPQPSRPTLTDEERIERAQAARAELCRRKLSAFVRFAWPHLQMGAKYEHNWHIDAVCDHTQRQLEEWACAREGGPAQVCKDLLTNIPPRCLKSTLVSVCATAWALLRWPTIKIGCLSVNPRVSFRDALACRTLIQSTWFQQSFVPDWQLRDDQNSVSNFGTTQGGSRVARGFDSNVVGEGFDWLLIDDPHDPRDTAEAIQKVIDGWDAAVGSRVSDARYSIRSCIMQCVRDDDFSAHVLKQGWGRLCLPMEYEAEYTVESPYGWHDPRTIEGEVLHPVRFPTEVLDKLKVERGSFGYAAQYQQRPQQFGGGTIKRAWLKRFTMSLLPQLDWMTVSCDATFGAEVEPEAKKKKKDPDNVGLLVIGGSGPRRFVLCDATRRMSFLESIAAIKALIETYPSVQYLLVENAAAGGPIVASLKKEIEEGGLRAITIEMIDPRKHGSKKDRVIASLPQLESGMVHVLDGAAWETAFVDELALFPNASHDDRVDALTQVLIHWAPTSVVDRWNALAKT